MSKNNKEEKKVEEVAEVPAGTPMTAEEIAANAPGDLPEVPETANQSAPEKKKEKKREQCEVCGGTGLQSPESLCPACEGSGLAR